MEGDGDGEGDRVGEAEGDGEADRDGEGDGDGEADRDGDGDGDCGGVVPLQATPLILKSVGFGLLVVQVPLKPMAVDEPVASDWFQSRPVAVTALPDWLQLADQPWATFCPLFGKVKVSFQLLTASPRFWMVRLADMPPCHSLTS